MSPFGLPASQPVLLPTSPVIPSQIGMGEKIYLIIELTFDWHDILLRLVRSAVTGRVCLFSPAHARSSRADVPTTDLPQQLYQQQLQQQQLQQQQQQQQQMVGFIVQTFLAFSVLVVKWCCGFKGINYNDINRLCLIYCDISAPQFLVHPA